MDLICKKGKFGYLAFDGELEISKPMIRNKDGQFKEVDIDEALSVVADKIDAYSADEI